MKTRSTDDLAPALTAADVLHAPVNDYRRYVEDARVVATGAVTWLEHPQVGRIPLHRIPGLPSCARSAPSPAVGEHTREVLARLGLAPAAIDALAAAGVVRVPV